MKTAFWQMIDDFARQHPRGAPPIPVMHPQYGLLGKTEHGPGRAPGCGFKPERGRWASVHAIQRDHARWAIKALRKFEDYAPRAGMFLGGLLAAQPQALQFALGAISNYDGIITARGSGALQDVWMQMTATQTPVTLSWYDMMKFASWVPMTNPTIANYANGGTGGAVTNAASNGSWLTNPAGSNKKYIVSCGLNTSNVTGFALAMLYDCLWAGNYVLTANATINPTSDVPVTRWASTTPGNADYAGGNMMQCALSATLTHTGAGTNTVTYTDQAGTTGKTMASITPATGPLVNRVLFNTTQASATVITATPFMPLTNAGSSGVTSLEQVVISGGTISSGAVDHKIVRPVLIMPFIVANSYIEQDATLNIGNMVELHNVSQVCGCLAWDLFSAGTSASSMCAFLRMVEG